MALAASVDYYKLLGVRRNADTATIKRAYKDLAKKYHPDKFKGPSPVKMEDLNRAHEVLTDPDLRKKYDTYGQDPEDQEVQRKEEMKARQQEYAQFHNIFGGGRRNNQYIESQTQTLTAHNYEELVGGMGQIWLIQVWREGAPHCHEISPAWEEAAKELKGIVQFGRINYDRNGGLLQFRLRTLPTLYAVTPRGETRLMNNRNSYTTDEIVKFASGIVTSISDVERIDARSIQRFLTRSTHLDKVHVILFDNSEKDWAAYHSAAMAPAWKDTIVFAIYQRPKPTDTAVLQYDINPAERSVVIIRENGENAFFPGAFEKKTGIRSRKVLVRFLLQNQYPLVPQVTSHNWAHICLGLGRNARGLHSIEHLLPARRSNNSTVCVLSLSNGSNTKQRAGALSAMRDAARMLALEPGVESSAAHVQFGWALADKSDGLWQYLVKRKMLDDSQDETVAMIDWEHGWCKALGKGEVVRSKEAAWLHAWVKTSLSEIEESSEVIPVVAVRRSTVDKLMSMFSFQGEGGGAGGGDGKEEGKGKTSGLAGSTWLGLVFTALALINLLTSKAAQTTPNARQRAAPQQQERSSSFSSRQQAEAAAAAAAAKGNAAPQQDAKQRSARESTPVPENSRAGAGGAAAAGASAGAQMPRGTGSDDGKNTTPYSSARSSNANGEEDGNGDGVRRRAAAGGAAASGKAAGAGAGDSQSDLSRRLGNCSVGELRKFAESHKINISDCLQKDEIVTRIIRSM